MLEIAILKNFDSGTYKAGVQLAGSLTTYFDDISVAKNIPSSALVIGNYVIVALPGGNPKDACIIATWPQGSPGGGAGSFLDLSDTPASYSGQVGKSAVVNKGENALEFLARAKISVSNKTIYIYKDATGNNDGTSWENAFTSWAACKAYLTGWIIAHDWTIKVRKGSTPYREMFDLNGFVVWGTLTIEAEYYWQGDCEANATAGNIVDTGAFANVAVGDKVCVLDLNGANGRAQDYEICTVDDVSGAPNTIGTDGSKTATTGWTYWIVRTEISGSDDGTDGGTARNHCFWLKSIDNVNIYGFYMTFSDSYVVLHDNCRYCQLMYFIAEDCDAGAMAQFFSNVITYYGYIEAIYYCYRSYRNSVNSGGYLALTCTVPYAICVSEENSYLSLGYGYLISGSRGTQCRWLSTTVFNWCTIANGVSTGAYARFNSIVDIYLTTNSAPTPEDPAGTSEGAYIG